MTDMFHTLRIVPAPPLVKLEVAVNGVVQQVIPLPAGTTLMEVFSPSASQRATGLNFCLNFIGASV